MNWSKFGLWLMRASFKESCGGGLGVDEIEKPDPAFTNA
jgi:hypothetical protein